MSQLATTRCRSSESIHLPNETELLEVISQADNPSAVLSSAYHALDDAVGAVMQTMLSGNGQAVQYIVDPLMTTKGPLGDIKVRAGLLLGLGVMSQKSIVI